jgi:hypothetical protein
MSVRWVNSVRSIVWDFPVSLDVVFKCDGAGNLKYFQNYRCKDSSVGSNDLVSLGSTSFWRIWIRCHFQPNVNLYFAFFKKISIYCLQERQRNVNCHFCEVKTKNYLFSKIFKTGSRIRFRFWIRIDIKMKSRIRISMKKMTNYRYSTRLVRCTKTPLIKRETNLNVRLQILFVYEWEKEDWVVLVPLHWLKEFFRRFSAQTNIYRMFGISKQQIF